MRKVIILSGVPGSGKSTYALDYFGKHENCMISSTDALRFELGGSYTNFNNEKEVWQRFYNDAYKFLSEHSGGVVVLDATFLRARQRKTALSRIRGWFTEIQVELHQLTGSKELISKRNLERNKPVPLNKWQEMYDAFEEVTAEEKQVFDSVLIIDAEVEDNGY